jgi:uncharacterized sporulation protein YeaH/YhbH (DUF444 family)
MFENFKKKCYKNRRRLTQKLQTNMKKDVEDDFKSQNVVIYVIFVHSH